MDIKLNVKFQKCTDDDFFPNNNGENFVPHFFAAHILKDRL